MGPGSSGTHPCPVNSRGLLPAAVLTLLLLGVLTVVLAFPLAESAPSQTRPLSPSVCQRISEGAAQRAGIVTGRGAPVLVIGDSWSAGFKLGRRAGSWPSRLPGRVFVDGFPGSGYSVGASPCGAVSYGDRVTAAVQRSDADLVVVQGGLNDFDQPDDAIEAGFDRVMAAVRGRDVVVVGPALAPSRAGAVPHVEAQLRSLCADAGVAYISSTDLDLPYLPDELHLTRAGHRVYGDAIAERIDRILQARRPRPGRVPFA